jgi:hypothetical protein
MPLFPCGAIPHSSSSESPAEKMHAHLRSYYFCRQKSSTFFSQNSTIFVPFIIKYDYY